MNLNFDLALRNYQSLGNYYYYYFFSISLMKNCVWPLVYSGPLQIKNIMQKGTLYCNMQQNKKYSVSTGPCVFHQRFQGLQKNNLRYVRVNSMYYMISNSKELLHWSMIRQINVTMTLRS